MEEEEEEEEEEEVRCASREKPISLKVTFWGISSSTE